eukprot:6895399-Pyramimonas_sp.AAC.1
MRSNVASNPDSHPPRDPSSAAAKQSSLLYYHTRFTDNYVLRQVGMEGLSVRDLADKLAVNEAEVIKTLFLKGVACSVTQTLDRDLVAMVAEVRTNCRRGGSIYPCSVDIVDSVDSVNNKHSPCLSVNSLLPSVKSLLPSVNSLLLSVNPQAFEVE